MYSDVKCSIVNVHFQWMPVVLSNVFAFKGRTIPYMINPCFSYPQKARLRHYARNKCKFAAVCFHHWCLFLSCSFWIDRAAAACQQTSSMLTGHLRRPKFDLATNSSEKHFEHKINSCRIWGFKRREYEGLYLKRIRHVVLICACFMEISCLTYTFWPWR